MSDTPQVPATIPAEPLPPTFDAPAAVALARDLAQAMFEVPTILATHKLTPGQYETIKAWEWFAKLVSDLSDEWKAPKNAQQRLATGALIGLETVLPDVIARMKVTDEPLPGIAQLTKVLADIAGVGGSNKVAAPATEKFNIVINLGADTETYEKTVPVTVDGNNPLPADTSRVPEIFTIQAEPEKT